jgi:hypothetical protein
MAPELDYKIRREIRDARAKDPLVSAVALQERLEQQFRITVTVHFIDTRVVPWEACAWPFPARAVFRCFGKAPASKCAVTVIGN